SEPSRLAAIVRVEERDEFSTIVYIVEAGIPCLGNTRPLLPGKPHSRIFCGKTGNDIRRRISRSVVHDDDVQIGIAPLDEERAYRRFNVRLAIIGRHDDTDLHTAPA